MHAVFDALLVMIKQMVKLTLKCTINIYTVITELYIQIKQDEPGPNKAQTLDKYMFVLETLNHY